jgi:hypothetical protein
MLETPTEPTTVGTTTATSRFAAFTREELAQIHFALRMSAKLESSEEAERLADEAWSLITRPGFFDGAPS